MAKQKKASQKQLSFRKKTEEKKPAEEKNIQKTPPETDPEPNENSSPVCYSHSSEVRKEYR